MAPMEAPDGTPTNAAYGFANTLIKYASAQGVTHAAVCFDHAMTSFRNDVEPEYKAQRGALVALTKVKRPREAI